MARREQPPDAVHMNPGTGETSLPKRACTTRSSPSQHRRGTICVVQRYRGAMADQTPDETHPWAPIGTCTMINADGQRGAITAMNAHGVNVTVPLQLLLDLAREAAARHPKNEFTEIMHEMHTYDVLSWTWTEPANDERGPLRRAARLFIQEVPLAVPVRRQLEDGSWGTVTVSPEEWARTEGRLTRG